jgi:hypothetical protein
VALLGGEREDARGGRRAGRALRGASAAAGT